MQVLNRRNNLIVLAALLCVAGVSADPDSFYRGGLRHIEGEGLGYCEGYTTLEAFKMVNPFCSYNYFFADARGHVFNNGRWAANVGVGVRKPLYNQIVGANIYYDYRNTNRKTFNEIGFGIELLSGSIDARFNAYFPVGVKKSSSFNRKFDHFEGHRMWIRRSFEVAKTGLDAELGVHIDSFLPPLYCPDLNFYAACGPYYYAACGGKNVYGARARLSADLSNYVSLDLTTTYDNVFRMRAQAQISVNIPFGPCCSTPCKKEWLTQPVYRNEILVIHKHRKKTVARNPATHAPYTFWFVDNTSHSAGTFESPFPTLAQAQYASAPNDVIYVFAGDGTTRGMDAGIVLQDSQFFFGASTLQHLPTTKGWVTIPPQSQSTLVPTITNTGGDVITLANNNVISGFVIQNTAGIGINSPATPISNVSIRNNILTSLGNIGISLNNVSGLAHIANNQLSLRVLQIIASNISDTQYWIHDNTITSDLDGVAATLDGCSNVNITLKDNIINTARTGFVLQTNNLLPPEKPNTFFICDNAFTTFSAGMTVSTFGVANSLFSIRNNSINSNLGMAFTLTNNSSTSMDIENNQLVTSSTGIGIQGVATAYINIKNNDFHTGSLSALSFIQHGDSQFTVNIEKNLIQGVILQGLAVQTNDNAIGNFNISKNIIRSTNYGIFMQSQNNSQLNASIDSNILESTFTAGMNLISSNTSHAKWHVNNNIFSGYFSAGAVIQSNDSSTTCLQFSDNRATPIEVSPSEGAYQFEQNGGSTFHLEPLVGNVGVFTGNATTPNVPPGACD